jgi:hypothetical protein
MNAEYELFREEYLKADLTGVMSDKVSFEDFLCWVKSNGKMTRGVFEACINRLSNGMWRRCYEDPPRRGVYVVAVWDEFVDSRLDVVRCGVPGWYLKSGVEMVEPKFWTPLPENLRILHLIVAEDNGTLRRGKL